MGGSETRPYDYNDCVDVVWHNDKFIQLEPGIMFNQTLPDIEYNTSCFIQIHFTVDHITEYRFPVLCHHGYKIRPGLRIIVIFQTYGTPMVFFFIIGHGLASVSFKPSQTRFTDEIP